MTFDQFKKEWEENILPNESQFIRIGQSLMNYLITVRRDLNDLISELEPSKRYNTDCFYNDQLVQNALDFLEEHWGYQKENYSEPLQFLHIRGVRKESKLDFEFATKILESWDKLKK